MMTIIIRTVDCACLIEESVFPQYLGGPYLQTSYQVIDIDASTGNIAVAGYSSDFFVLEGSSSHTLNLGSVKPIVMLIERPSKVKWQVYL